MKNQNTKRKPKTNSPMGNPVNNSVDQPVSKNWAIASMVLSAFPILILVLCVIASGGSFNENGPGAVWWLLAMYYFTVGVPFLAMSIAFGVVGLKSELSWLARASLWSKLLLAFLFFMLALLG